MFWSSSHARSSNRPVYRNRNRRRWFGTPEHLEGRTLLSTFNWVSPVDGNFNNSAMWVNTQTNKPGVPGPGDNAVTPSGDYTITASNSTTVNSLQNGGSLTVTGGTFSVNNTLNAATSTVNDLTVDAGASFHSGGTTTTLTGGAVIAGNLEVSAGATLVLNGTSINLNTGNTLTGAGTFDIISGVNVNAPTTASLMTVLDSGNAIGLTGTGAFTVPSGSTFDWRSGYMTGLGGATDIASGATLSLDGTDSKDLMDRALNNAGSGTWSGTGSWSVVSSAVFTNSGTFTVQNDEYLTTDPTYAEGSVVNTGTWTKTSPSGTGTTDITDPFKTPGARWSRRAACCSSTIRAPIRGRSRSPPRPARSGSPVRAIP